MHRIVLPLILAAAAAGGCDKSAPKPNPEMQVPDIPPGRGSKAEPTKAPKR